VLGWFLLWTAPVHASLLEPETSIFGDIGPPDPYYMAALDARDRARRQLIFIQLRAALDLMEQGLLRERAEQRLALAYGARTALEAPGVHLLQHDPRITFLKCLPSLVEQLLDILSELRVTGTPSRERDAGSPHVRF
jgi:hypothetical protein